MTQQELQHFINNEINEVKSEGRVDNLEKNFFSPKNGRHYWYWSCSMGNTWFTQ